MTITNTISREIASLVKGNQIYEDYRARYRFLFESYMGGEEYRKGQHLIRYQLETQQEYQARLQATPLQNHCRSVVSVYNSFLFRAPPTRDYGSLSATPELEQFLADSDYEGRSLDAFMKDAATWSAVFGHCWIIMSKPNIGAVTRADEQAQGLRPYVSVLTPMVVLDWAWERNSVGRYELSYLRYVEDINGDVKTIKEWWTDRVRTVVIDTYEERFVDDVVEDNQLGRIPAVICYNARSTVRGIGISAITDIADAQKLIYNATSEAFQSIQLDSHPSLVKTPETQAGVGAGAIIHMPENMDPGLKPYVLDFAGASVPTILETIKHTIESIDKMANTGAVRATESRTLSGVAMETEFSLLNARLSEMADNLELAEEHLWRLFCLYQGYSYDMSIEYPGSFNIRDNEKEIQQLQTAKSAATDPRVIAMIDKKILEWMGEEMMEDMMDYAEQSSPAFEPHIMINPQSGQQRIAATEAEHLELAAQGWQHQGE